MSDANSNAARAEMQSLVLQPFPRYGLPVVDGYGAEQSSVPPLNGLSYEQKLAYAAYHLEQHEQRMKDKIREAASCAQKYAVEEAGPATFPSEIRSEPRPEDFRDVMRLGWKSHKPKPVVMTSRRSQPVFGAPPSNEHVGIAKRAIEELDTYDAHFQSTLSAIQRAQDSRSTGHHFSGSSGAPTPITSARQVEQNAIRDPRIRDRDARVAI